MSLVSKLNTLLTAGVIGASSLLPVNKAEAQTQRHNTFSYFLGTGSPQLNNTTLDINGNNYDFQFRNSQIFGFDIGRRFFPNFRVSPSLEIGGYVSQNLGGPVEYIGLIGGGSPSTGCEFGEKTVAGHKRCIEFDNTLELVQSFTAGITGNINVRPPLPIHPINNNLTLYAGGGPRIRWSRISILGHSSTAKDKGYEFQVGARFKFSNKVNGGEVWLEYAQDDMIPDFDRFQAHPQVILNDPERETFQRFLLGYRKFF